MPSHYQQFLNTIKSGKNAVQQMLRDYEPVDIKQGIKDLPGNIGLVAQEFPNKFNQVATAASPIETAVASMIAGVDPKMGIEQSIDIPQALMSRGMPGIAAYPLGIAASVAIPGAGELKTGKQIAENISEAAIKMLDKNDMELMGLFNALVKNGKGQKALKELGNAIDPIVEGLGIPKEAGAMKIKSAFEEILNRQRNLLSEVDDIPNVLR